MRGVGSRTLTFLPRRVLPLLVPCFACLVSCTGSITGTSSSPGPETDSGGAGPRGNGPNESAGPLRLRHLSRREYNNTIGDLLGQDLMATAATFSQSFSVESSNDGGFDAPGEISGDASIFWDAAEKLAGAAKSRLATSCDVAKRGEDACIRDLIMTFGRRAYRRPLEDLEIARLDGLFKSTRPMVQDYESGVAFVVQAMLQSPNFLYHWEAGSARATPERGLVSLSDHQVAARLSYLFWGTMPDAALFAAADAKQLGTVADVAAQARRLIKDARFGATVADFHRQWLLIGNLENLVRDPALYPDFKDATKRALLGRSIDAELAAFTDDVVRIDGHLRTLLTGRPNNAARPYSFVNAPLGKIYGVDGAPESTLTNTRLNPMERAGILTQTAFLATMSNTQTSSPVKRAVWMWRHLLCRAISPPPDPEAVDKAKMALPHVSNQSTRQYFERLTSGGVCAGCHQPMNPFGFAFEHYGALGEHRTQDGGQIVNSSSTVTLDGAAASFRDAIDLAAALAASDEVRQCVATKWFRYAMGRLENEADQPSLEIASRRLASSDGDLRELLVAVAQTKAFRFRALAPGEGP